MLVDYFPTPLRERYADRMTGHRLRREIVTTSVVNEVGQPGRHLVRVPGGGGDRRQRGRRDPGLRGGAGGLRPARAVASGGGAGQPAADDARRPTVYLEVRRLVDRAVRWLVTNRRSPIDVTAEIARLQPGVAKLLPQLAELFRGRERETLLAAQRAALVERPARRTWPDCGDPGDVRLRAAGHRRGGARRRGRDLTEVAGVYFVLSERFRVDDLLSKISALPREDRWQTLARMALRYDLYAALAALTDRGAGGDGPRGETCTAEDRVAQWEQANATEIARARNAIGEFDDARADLAPLSVLLRQIRTLVKASST